MEAYAHELRHKDAMGLLAALGPLDEVLDVEAGLQEVLDRAKGSGSNAE